MSAHQRLTTTARDGGSVDVAGAVIDHLDLWTQAVTQKSTAGRSRTSGKNGKVELTGIKKLRELILELAVRGKLVEQDPDDEPAKSLLDKIDQEITSLVKQGCIKKPKPVPQTADSDKFFEIPDAWQWVRLGSLALHSEAGWSPKCHDSPRENQSWAVLKVSAVTWGEFRPGENKQLPANLTPRSEYEVHPSDFLISRANTSELVARSVVVPEGAPTKLMMSDKIIRFVFSKQVEPLYLNLFNNSPFARNYYLSVAGGTSSSMKNVSRAQIQTLPVPLPPLDEQHRIVQKVDELMALCDRLEQHTSDQLDAHETLVDTLLGTLTQSATATELADNWARLSEHFDTLFTTEQSIDKLKQTILQLAVMGRLVEQDEGDESATKLLTSIELRKQDLVKAKKIKFPKKLPAITLEEAFFEIPRNWQWVKFGELGIFINGDRSKNYPNKDEYVERGVAWINTGHIEPDGTLTRHHMHFITREKYDSLRSGKIEPTDLVYCLRGATFGKTAFVIPYEEGAIASSLMIVRPYLPAMRSYIYRYLTSPFGRSQIFRFDNGSAQPNLSANSVMMYAFPLPPLEEQRRIVKKVDELMALCDHLTQRLNQASDTRCQLAGAVVEGALEG